MNKSATIKALEYEIADLKSHAKSTLALLDLERTSLLEAARAKEEKATTAVIDWSGMIPVTDLRKLIHSISRTRGEDGKKKVLINIEVSGEPSSVAGAIERALTM